MNNLKMPANYIELNANEISEIDGGREARLSEIFYALGKMFGRVEVTEWTVAIEEMKRSHGEVASIRGSVYTFSDGYTYTVANGGSIRYFVGDFFYGIGDLFRAFGM